MNTRNKVAFVIYLLCCIVSIGFGLVYIAAPAIMPYHQQAIGGKWEDLGTGLQTLLKGMVNTAGAGLLVVGIYGLFVLLIPFRRGENWAKWAIAINGIIWSGMSSYVSVTIALKTGASVPWPVSILTAIMIIVAFILSLPIRSGSGIGRSV